MEFMNKFENVLHKLESYHLEVNIIGDINCNVGTTSYDSITQINYLIFELPTSIANSLTNLRV